MHSTAIPCPAAVMPCYCTVCPFLVPIPSVAASLPIPLLCYPLIPPAGLDFMSNCSNSRFCPSFEQEGNDDDSRWIIKFDTKADALAFDLLNIGTANCSLEMSINSSYVNVPDFNCSKPSQCITLLADQKSSDFRFIFNDKTPTIANLRRQPTCPNTTTSTATSLPLPSCPTCPAAPCSTTPAISPTVACDIKSVPGGIAVGFGGLAFILATVLGLALLRSRKSGPPHARPTTSPDRSVPGPSGDARIQRQLEEKDRQLANIRLQMAHALGHHSDFNVQQFFNRFQVAREEVSRFCIESRWRHIRLVGDFLASGAALGIEVMKDRVDCVVRHLLDMSCASQQPRHSSQRSAEEFMRRFVITNFQLSERVLIDEGLAIIPMARPNSQRPQWITESTWARLVRLLSDLDQFPDLKTHSLKFFKLGLSAALGDVPMHIGFDGIADTDSYTVSYLARFGVGNIQVGTRLIPGLYLIHSDSTSESKFRCYKVGSS
ncbi:hypothetical protein BJ742DRAFT_832437, partial [Cladochytrium replicatum]